VSYGWGGLFPGTELATGQALVSSTPPTRGRTTRLVATRHPGFPVVHPAFVPFRHGFLMINVNAGIELGEVLAAVATGAARVSEMPPRISWEPCPPASVCSPASTEHDPLLTEQR